MGPFTALSSCACRYCSIVAQQVNTIKGPLLRRYVNQKREKMNSEEVYFKYSVRLRIFSESGLNFKDIENNLSIIPNYTHRKGDRRTPKSPEYKHDMWSYKLCLDKTEPLENYLYKLWSEIKPHKEYILNLKNNATVDIFCGYRSNSDTAGIQVAHQSLEIFRELEIDFGLSIIII